MMMKRELVIILACVALFLGACKKKDAQEVKLGDTPDAVAQDLDYSKSENIVKLYWLTDSLNRVGKADYAKMQLFLDNALAYAEKNPKDTLSPHFMLYSGIFQMQLAFSNPEETSQKDLSFKAIEIFNKVLELYPKYKNGDYCYFYKGQIYENLHRNSDAENEYRELVHQYPNSPLGKSTKEYLQAQGFEKSAEQLWEDVKKKEKKSKK